MYLTPEADLPKALPYTGYGNRQSIVNFLDWYARIITLYLPELLNGSFKKYNGLKQNQLALRIPFK